MLDSSNHLVSITLSASRSMALMRQLWLTLITAFFDIDVLVTCLFRTPLFLECIIRAVTLVTEVTGMSPVKTSLQVPNKWRGFLHPDLETDVDPDLTQYVTQILDITQEQALFIVPFHLDTTFRTKPLSLMYILTHGYPSQQHLFGGFRVLFV
ncbi:hypothetical protein ABKN59_002596 [Abortiporus biennis]